MKNIYDLNDRITTIMLVIILVGLLALSSCVKESSATKEEPIATYVTNTPISVIPLSDANMQIWENNGIPMNDTLQAFSINLEQLNCMIYLLNNNPVNVKGFRLYFAGDSVIMCAINDEGSDIKDPIVTTTSVNSGPCPEICDMEGLGR